MLVSSGTFYSRNPHLVEDLALAALLNKYRHIKQMVTCEELGPLDAFVQPWQ